MRERESGREIEGGCIAEREALLVALSLGPLAHSLTYANVFTRTYTRIYEYTCMLVCVCVLCVLSV